VKAALFKDEFARNEAGAPFEFLGTVLLAVTDDVFLGNAKHDGSYF